jgi:predicted nucleotidyltransferase
MLPTPYEELNKVLNELVSSIAGILRNTLIGVYLQGSFAVGGFDQHSDVDFIVAVEDELSPAEVDALQVMHDQIYDLESAWAKHLEGSYFPREVLRRSSDRGRDLWYLNHGARSLIRSDHCNTILVRWVVRERGIALTGPPPKTLIDPIPQKSLRADIFETMMREGRHILDEPDKCSNRFYQGFIVLNFCRMLHDLIRGYPGSKREGAAWAKSNLDPSWSGLIDRAWDCRPDPARQVREPAEPGAYARTLRFLAFVLDQSKRYMSDGR